MTAPIHPTAALGFNRAGADYELGRPGYPRPAIERVERELGIGPGRTVLDLAAGTGKLTRELSASGARMIALEPVAGMREQLRGVLPALEILDATAEEISLADGSVDAVLVAQAFHWFDVPRAAAEIHRILRPGGGLAIFRNSREKNSAWMAELQELIDNAAGQTPRQSHRRWQEELAATGLFTEPEEAVYPNPVRGTPEQVVARVASISYIAALDEPERRRVLERVLTILASHPETAGRTEFPVPYRTTVIWCRRRP